MVVDLFLWSDNIWVEENRAWFVAANMNALFEWDINIGKCRLLKEFPDYEFGKVRKHSSCIKCGDNIFCFPYTEDYIWVYNLINHDIKQMVINNPLKQWIPMTVFWNCGDKIYAVAGGIKRLIEIDTKEKKITHYHEMLNDGDEISGRSIKVEQSIYTLGLREGSFYEYHMATNTVQQYDIQGLKPNMYAMCFDGENFWSCGCSKEIYIWNKQSGVTQVLDDFPKDFGQYDFEDEREEIVDCLSRKYSTYLFCKCINTKQNVWFIPWKSNKILYVDKKTNRINCFEIKEEEEDRISLQNRAIKFKYLFEYFRDDRYIGIYSFKNQSVLEIDTEKLSWVYKNFSFKMDDELAEFIRTHNEQFDSYKILREQKNFTNLWLLLYREVDRGGKIKDSKVGFNIHKEMAGKNKWHNNININ